jgi:hypothetical protein
MQSAEALAVGSAHSLPIPLASSAGLPSFVAFPLPVTLQFLIANPRLEIRASHCKQMALTFSNREEIAFFLREK